MKTMHEVIKDQREQFDAAEIKWLEANVRPHLEALFAKLKGRNIRNGVHIVQGMGTTFLCSAPGEFHTIGVDRLYHAWQHSCDTLCEKWPELEEIMDILDTVEDEYKYIFGDFA